MKIEKVCTGSGFITLDILDIPGNISYPVYSGGSFSNVMCNLAFLGWKSMPIARIGSDLAADLIIEDMARCGVDTKSLLLDKSIKTPLLVQRQISNKSQDHRFISRCPKCSSFFPSYTSVKVKSIESESEKIKDSSVYYFDRASPGAIKGAEIAKASGGIVVFEPSSFNNHTQLLRSVHVADIIKYSSERSKGIGIDELNAEKIYIETHGSAGLRYKLPRNTDASADWHWVRPYSNSTVVDSSGAGDWTTAGMIHFLSVMASKDTHIDFKCIENALMFGQALATLNCSFYGARGIMYNMAAEQVILSAHTLAAGNALVFPAQKPGLPKVNNLSELSSLCFACFDNDDKRQSRSKVAVSDRNDKKFIH